MEPELVSIAGLDKATVLMAAHNAAEPVGFGILRAQARNFAPLTIGEAHEYLAASAALKSDRTYFDYVEGRPLKLDISGDLVDPAGYDENNGGPGSFARVIARLRAKEW